MHLHGMAERGFIGLAVAGIVVHENHTRKRGFDGKDLGCVHRDGGMVRPFIRARSIRVSKKIVENLLISRG
jgi:hypothetical protein